MKLIKNIFIIIFIFIVIVLIIKNYKNKEFFNNKKKDICKKTKIIEKDSLNDYLNYVNNNPKNNNFFVPDNYIPFNISNNFQYNILNNFGIKNNKQLQDFYKELNNITPYNHNIILKNYNNHINKIVEKKQIDCKNYYVNCGTNPKIIGNYNEDYYQIFMSYNSNCYNLSYFIIHYKNISKCQEIDIEKEKNSFTKLRLDYNLIKTKNIIEYLNGDIVVNQNPYNNRNIYNIKFNNFDKEENYAIFITFNNGFKTYYSNVLYT